MSLRSDILAALRSAGDAGMSGEAIAREAGVSRAAVAKHIALLRSWGYEIDAQAGEGYVLVAAPGLAIPAEVEPLLQDSLWVRVEGDVISESTNDDARQLAVAGAPEGTVVVAASQSAGRGRMGRTWDSPRGGAYLSAILRPAVPAFEIAALPLVIAIGVARGLETLGCSPKLKWPNDVELAQGKVAGILLELSAQADRVEWVVAGIGLNVSGELPSQRASCVMDEAPEVDPPAAAAAVLDGVAGAYREWVASGFEALADEYTKRHRLGGEHVVVRDLAGAIVVEGIAEGVDTFGRLLVNTPDGVTPVSSGDVTLRPE